MMSPIGPECRLLRDRITSGRNRYFKLVCLHENSQWYLAAALASGKITSGNPKRPRTNFPFADTLANLDNHIDKRGACKDLPAEITKLFRGFSPYKGGANDPLWGLHELCNIKKHCALVPLQINKALAFFSGEIVGEGWSMHVVSPSSADLGWDPKRNEITLMSVISKPDANPNIDADVAFDVAIEGIETLGRERARYELAAMRGIVGRIVHTTEEVCRSLGFQLD